MPYEYGTEITRFDLGVTVMRRYMNTRLDQTLPSVLEATLQIIPKVLGSVTDWVEFCPWEQLDLVANMMMQRVWFGPELSKNPSWHVYSIAGERDFYSLANELSHWGFLLKPIAAMLSPRGRRFRKNMVGAQDFLVPMIRDYLQQHQDAKGEEKDEKPVEDWVKWWTHAAQLDTTYRAPIDRQCELIMYTFYDATFALRFQLSMELFDLAAYPEYIEPLRQEIREKFDTAEDPASISTLRSMSKLDSWMKESLRMNPPTYLAGEREVCEPLTLSNGLHLPKGVKLGITAAQRAIDPKYWELGHEFDGFRFEKLRAGGTKPNQDYTFTGSTLDMPLFGKGLQYCPARFLMDYTIKLGLISLLKHYDFKLLGGEEKRPANPCNGIIPSPPPGQLLIRPYVP
ncbi:MAG: hypothetical protein Q9197_002046 [Variospora fuerteventurae]